MLHVFLAAQVPLLAVVLLLVPLLALVLAEDVPLPLLDLVVLRMPLLAQMLLDVVLLRMLLLAQGLSETVLCSMVELPLLQVFLLAQCAAAAAAVPLFAVLDVQILAVEKLPKQLAVVPPGRVQVLGFAVACEPVLA